MDPKADGKVLGFAGYEAWHLTLVTEAGKSSLWKLPDVSRFLSKQYKKAHRKNFDAANN